MKRKTDSGPKPGSLAAMLAFLGEPGKESTLTLVHEPNCSTKRGEQCDCHPEIKRGSE